MPSPATPEPSASSPKMLVGSLRSDAERNRRAIVAAATEAFREKGVDVSIDEIARRAGVGSATLYRRFPTRDHLLAAAMEERVVLYADRVDEALNAKDPWTGFCGLVYSLCELQASDAGLRDLVATASWEFPMLDEIVQRARRSMEKVVARAKHQGTLRADFHPDDLTTLFMANAGIISAGIAAPPLAWRRHTSYMIDAFRSQPAIASSVS